MIYPGIYAIRYYLFVIRYQEVFYLLLRRLLPDVTQQGCSSEAYLADEWYAFDVDASECDDLVVDDAPGGGLS